MGTTPAPAPIPVGKNQTLSPGERMALAEGSAPAFISTGPADALPGSGLVLLAAPEASNPTLASITGNLTIVSGSDFAHVVSASPASIFDGSGTPKDTITFPANQGANISLFKAEGFAVVSGQPSNGVALSVAAVKKEAAKSEHHKSESEPHHTAKKS